MSACLKVCSTMSGRISSRWSRLVFDGDERNYELWETKFLGHLRLLKLKDTILNGPAAGADGDALAEDETKNAEAYAELIQFLDDKSLSLVMREAADDGRGALKILRDYYAGKGKPRIVSLYTELTSLQKLSGESVTDYVIRAETSITALRNAGEVLSDGLLVAMVLKGLPESFKLFSIFVTQSDETLSFAGFKTKLRSYENTEGMRTAVAEDNVMGARTHSSRASAPADARLQRTESGDIECFRCGQRGHKARQCRRGQHWYSQGRSTTWRGEPKQWRQDNARGLYEETDSTFAFTVVNSDRHPRSSVIRTGLMVDTGATSHIITDLSMFKSFDDRFQAETHCVELADGTRCKGVAERRGEATVCLVDSRGRHLSATLKQALYIPSYPQNIFSVRAATSSGATVIFKEGEDVLQYKDGTRFSIHEHNRLFYLPIVPVNMNNDCGDQCMSCHDIQRWHEILGHCNFNDVQKLENVVDGMSIRGKTSHMQCEVCVQGKFTQSRNREPDVRAKSALELVHTDLAGPIEPESREGYKYAISFTDDYSSAVSVYFLKHKSDTVDATERFLADMAPYGNVTCIRSDNGTEFTGQGYQALLRRNRIRHETSAPYSPHQNGTAERNWRTLFDMARCMLLGSQLPKELWPYAVQTAVVVRNRCFNNRTRQTPYFMLTGRRPNVSRMQTFGTVCYAYRQNRKKLDSKSDKGIFVGYDKNSPAYMVYYPDSRKVMKHRLVRFMTNDDVSDDYDVGVQYSTTRPDPDKPEQGDIPETEPGPSQVSLQPAEGKTESHSSDSQSAESRYPVRERRKPDFYGVESDQAQISIDYCYKMVSNVPQTFREAVNSSNSREWLDAMDDEMKSLRDNNTFTLTTLPEGKKAVGGRWVYAMKSNADGSAKYKARYVAKGYSQEMGVDYGETFSPTANFTSVRVLMQKAAQEDLILHQMDVKTAYLHAPIDYEIYMEQPEGYDVISQTSGKMVCKLEKSLYGLKQSGRNWNKMLHDYLCENDFVQNPADHCVYKRETEQEKVIMLIWVDDLLIAASDERALKTVKEMLTEKFQMKDLGRLKTFLGITFDQSNVGVSMSQQTYVDKLLEKFDMQDCKPRLTPCEPKLSYTDGQEKLNDPRKYREAVGSLIYLTLCTRPDLSYVVSKLSQYFSGPTEEQWTTVKHVLKYLKCTNDKMLCYRKCDEGLRMVAYSDADWAGDTNDRRSTSGYCVSLCKNGPPISWKTRKQPTVALSTCEAEYIALAATTQECLHLTQLLVHLDDYQYGVPMIYEDNQGTIALAKNPVSRQRCKHIDIKYHFVRSTVNNGDVFLEYCPTDQMVADLMTKPATKVKLLAFSRFLFGL